MRGLFNFWLCKGGASCRGHFSREYVSLTIDLPLMFFCFFVLLFCLLPNEQSLSCKLAMSCFFEKLLGPQLFFLRLLDPVTLVKFVWFILLGGGRGLKLLARVFLN